MKWPSLLAKKQNLCLLKIKSLVESAPGLLRLVFKLIYLSDIGLEYEADRN